MDGGVGLGGETMKDSGAKEFMVIHLDSKKSFDSGTSGSNHSAGRAAQVPYMDYKNTLTSWEMESVVAICDTFLPPVEVPPDGADEATARFFRSCASKAGTPQLIGGLISNGVEHPRTWQLRVALWFLSTRIGSLALCGWRCLSPCFPFVWRFAELPIKTREEIVRSWQLSFISLLRLFFKSFKLMTMLVFFTQVDHMNENLTWKAIGYSGPDPDFKAQFPRAMASKGHKSSEKWEDDEHQHGRSKEEREDEAFDEEEELFGPLYRGLIDVQDSRERVADTLRCFGFRTAVHLPQFPQFYSQHHNRFSVPLSSSLSRPCLTIKCDAVVVGSGSGGGVVAGMLARAGYKVLVLEKGQYRARSNLSLLEGPSMEQMYLGSGLLTTYDMSAVILAGSTVGGGSAINWAASIQTPQHVMKEWCEDHNLQLFGSSLYKEALNEVCQRMEVQSEVKEDGFNNAVLRKGCEELGYPVSNIPRNSPADHSCGWCCLGCKDGRKKGTSETWLVDLVKSGHGAILPGCNAIKVLTEKNVTGLKKRRATGVAFEFAYSSSGSKQVCIVESKVTVVACGAICTPALLKRSGLKNPNIGRNLHLHPVTMGWGYFPDTSMKSYEGGIMTAMSSPLSAKANSVNGGDKCKFEGAMIQTPALHPGMFAGLTPWVDGRDFKTRMCGFSKTAHVFALARDKGSGTVHSTTHISYQMKEADVEVLSKGLEKVLRIIAAAGAEEIGTHHCKGRKLNVKKASCHEFEKFVKEESRRAVKDFPRPIWSAHQMGSCRMGNDPKESAVDQMGETWEVEGLYVADASLLPSALGVNPMVTIQAIAYCSAESVIHLLKRMKP
uniref:long-chain-alcohol oxidase n=1 Tax=Kalanchoe fedtschenkoi TaxID=63787 RepID=A0A7N0V997_KALFE